MTVSFTYDNADRILTTTQPGGTGISKTVTYSYDAGSTHHLRLQKMTDPESAATTYGYDTAGRLVSVSNTLMGGISYTLDGAGRITRFDNTITMMYTLHNLDSAKRVYQVYNKKANGTVMSSFVYTLDNNGNTTQMQEAVVNPDTTTSSATVNYTYDAINRLLSEQRTLDISANNYYYKYAYDGSGNRLTVKDGNNSDAVISTYTYDSANKN